MVSREAITEEQNWEATTMAESVTEYERSLEEFGMERRAEGRAEVLCRQAGRRFGKEAGERLAEVLGTPPDSGRLSVAEAAIVECSTAEEMLRRVRGSSGA